MSTSPAPTPTAAIRNLLAGDPFLAADCYSALTARIVEHVGFSCAYMGGHATGMMHYAIPDNGALTPTEMIEQAARVCEAVEIPVIVDADQLGESVADVHRSVRRYEAAGVAAIHMEDELTPKHSTYDGPLMAVDEMQARIAAAVAARRDDDFVIIVRSDEFYVDGGGGGGSLEEAVKRGVAYEEAGADAYLPTFAGPEEIRAIASEVSIPLAGYGSLVDGLALALATGFGTASAACLHHHWATHLFEHGELPEEAFAFPDKDEIIGQGHYDAVISDWATRTGRPTREL